MGEDSGAAASFDVVPRYLTANMSNVRRFIVSEIHLESV